MLKMNRTNSILRAGIAVFIVVYLIVSCESTYVRKETNQADGHARLSERSDFNSRTKRSLCHGNLQCRTRMDRQMERQLERAFHKITSRLLNDARNSRQPMGMSRMNSAYGLGGRRRRPCTRRRRRMRRC